MRDGGRVRLRQASACEPRVCHIPELSTFAKTKPLRLAAVRFSRVAPRSPAGGLAVCLSSRAANCITLSASSTVSYGAELTVSSLVVPSSAERLRAIGAQKFTQDGLDFQTRIAEKSGLAWDYTALPPAMWADPPNISMAMARGEAELVMYPVVEAALKKTGAAYDIVLDSTAASMLQH